MQPGDTVRVVITVLNAGVAVTGLVTANFTTAYYLDATTPAAVFAVSEISGGRYRVALTLPATAGFLSVFITSNAGYTVQNGRYFGEIEAQDLDSMYAVVVRPISQLSTASAIAAEVQLTLNAYRRKSLSVSVVDQSGVAIDLSGYNNWRFTVWDATHTGGAALYTLSSGITGSVAGVVAWVIPESAAFFSAMTTAIAAGSNTTTLYYDMIADQAATAGNTECIFRGQLVLNRWEGTA